MEPARTMCGGFGNGKAADGTVQAVVDAVKASVEERLGNALTAYTAISYSTQVVAGTNYLVKVNTGDEKYIHVKVHKPLPHTVSFYNSFLILCIK